MDFSWNSTSLLSKDYHCYTMKDILNEVIYSNKKESIGKDVANFVFNNCTIEQAQQSLLSLINQSQLDLQYLLDIIEIKDILKQYVKYGRNDGFDEFSTWMKGKQDESMMTTKSENNHTLIDGKKEPLLNKLVQYIASIRTNRKFLDVQKSYRTKISIIRK